jgi:hypothetical protein
MKIAFYFATRGARERETLAYKSLQRLKEKDSNIDILYNTNNTTGLSILYNSIIETHKTDYTHIVFIHDDVYVDDLGVCEKLERAHTQFDIVGLAGGINPVIKEPALWHLMCGGFQSGNLRGAVSHPCAKDQIMFTSFGPTPSRVAILDGLFLSVDTRKIKSVGWKFNENYNFHHYDIASSIDANYKKLKLGVAPIWVLHNSPGLLSFEDKNFRESQEKFIKEYSQH